MWSTFRLPALKYTVEYLHLLKFVKILKYKAKTYILSWILKPLHLHKNNTVCYLPFHKMAAPP